MYKRPPLTIEFWNINIQRAAAGMQLVRLMHRLGQARWEVHDLIQTKQSDAPSVIRLIQLAQELKDLDEAFSCWEEMQPEAYQSKEVNITDLDPLDPRVSVMASQDFFDSVLVYEGIAPALALSHVRSARIFALQSYRDAQMILSQVEECNHSRMVEKEVILDVCRSVFQFLNREADEHGALFSTEILGGMRGLFLFWPLKAIGSASDLTSPSATEGQLQFARNVSAYLYRQQGLPQARHFDPTER